MLLTSQELQSKLWQAADILRGQIDSADYKSYIFSMLFLKGLSDRFDEEVANAVTAGCPERPPCPIPTSTSSRYPKPPTGARSSRRP